MRQVKAKQLPSGSWRVQLMIEGQKMSITAPTEEAATLKAMNILYGHEQHKKEPLSITLGTAFDRYIESKNSVLSPSTIYGYKNIRRNYFQDIMSKQLRSLSPEVIQREVNKMARTHSPKSVRNAHGLLGAVLKAYYPQLTLYTTMPQKSKYEAQIPTEADLITMIQASKGTELELPLLIAIWLGMRASEISGLKWTAFRDGKLYVENVTVYGENGYVDKDPKTFAGFRQINVPDYIVQLLEQQPKNSEYVVQMSVSAIYKRFVRMCKNANLPRYRFHDLRHVNASIMLALGVPDKYAMERMGHATNNMLKTVYQHTMQERMRETDATINQYFKALVSHEISHEK